MASAPLVGRACLMMTADAVHQRPRGPAAPQTSAWNAADRPGKLWAQVAR